MDYMTELTEKGKTAKQAARTLATLSTILKNQALVAMAAALEAKQSMIIAANAKDIDRAVANGMPKPLIDRLLLNETRIKTMAEALRQIAALPDPIGEAISGWRRPNGLVITKMRVPLGVIGIIYEARPNVTVDAAGLCLKAGNAVILRGGSEAIDSNKVITEIIGEAAYAAGVPAGAIALVETTDRQRQTNSRPWSFVTHGIFGNLHQHILANCQMLAGRLATGIPHIQKCIFVPPDINKSGLHPRKNIFHSAFVNVTN